VSHDSVGGVTSRKLELMLIFHSISSRSAFLIWLQSGNVL
jgi:hypothetical protein